MKHKLWFQSGVHFIANFESCRFKDLMLKVSHWPSLVCNKWWSFFFHLLGILVEKAMHLTMSWDCVSFIRKPFQIRDELRLNMYLALHVDELYELIRHRAIIQYFAPYAVADMNKMADIFRVPAPEVRKYELLLVSWNHMQSFEKYTFDAHKREWQ